MSIFDRIANITKAAVHEALNKLENPVLMTGQYLRNLEEDIHGAEAQLRELRITVKVLERQSEEALRLAEQSEQAALSAISEGDELTARSGLSKPSCGTLSRARLMLHSARTPRSASPSWNSSSKPHRKSWCSLRRSARSWQLALRRCGIRKA